MQTTKVTNMKLGPPSQISGRQHQNEGYRISPYNSMIGNSLHLTYDYPKIKGTITQRNILTSKPSTHMLFLC